MLELKQKERPRVSTAIHPIMIAIPINIATVENKLESNSRNPPRSSMVPKSDKRRHINSPSKQLIKTLNLIKLLTKIVGLSKICPKLCMQVSEKLYK